jgi:hypothetical protein
MYIAVLRKLQHFQIAGHRCQLTSLPACKRFSAAALNVWLAALFCALPPAMAAAGLQPVSDVPSTARLAACPCS